MAERGREVAGGVQHVGCHHDVVAVRVEALVDGVRLNVQPPLVDERIRVRQPFFRLGEETCGDVGEGVVEPPWWE